MITDDPTSSTTSRKAGDGLADSFGAPPGRAITIYLPFGSLALIAAFGSLAVCYASILIAAIIGVKVGDNALGLNPHVQAVIMWGLAALAVFALWRDRQRHGGAVPVGLGAAATLILIVTLYVDYDQRIEMLAYVLLVISALLNQSAFLGNLNGTVRNQAEQIRALNQSLERRVESQVEQIDRLGRLKQFLAAPVAELVVSDRRDPLLESHRRYIACLFCDLRNFTALAEEIDPEEVFAILQAYHDRVGGLVSKHNGTIGNRSGDGLMAFFNDPIPCADPALAAVRLGLDIRDSFAEIRTPWKKRGHDIGIGIGISTGYVTLGLVGVQGRSDYTAIGSAVNIASRLCDKAQDGAILLSQRAYQDVSQVIRAESIGMFDLKGISSQVEVFNVLALETA
jgi:class 3 adenylate cyclase